MRLVVAGAWLCVTACCQAAEIDDMLAKLERRHGICAAIGIDGAQALSVAKQSGYMVFFKARSRGDAERTAATAADEGLLNSRLYVDYGIANGVPFADNAVDLLLLPGDSTIPPDEQVRALTPGMGAIGVCERGRVDLKRNAKPFPAEMDNWGHWFHGPDNNPVSTDRIVKWPFLTQWVAAPYRGPQPGVGVVSHGRYFAAAGFQHSYGADMERMAPYRSKLTVFNAFNGIVLWERKLAENNPVARSGMIAEKEFLYLMEGNTIDCLDAESGKLIREIRFEGVVGELKWMGKQGDVIVALVGERDAEIKTPQTWSVQTKYLLPMVDDKGERHWGFSRTVAACNVKTGRTLWTWDESAAIDARTICLGDGRVYFASDKRVAALDASDGKLVWENSDKELLKLLSEPVKSFGHGGLQVPRPGMLFTPGALVINTKGRGNLVAVATSDGKLLWNKATRRAPVHTFFTGGHLYADGLGTLDAMSGKTSGKFTCAGTGCGPIVAAPAGFFGRHGMGYDRLRQLEINDNSSRGGCWQNCIVANGLMFMSPYLCGCPYTLRGHIVLSPAGSFEFDRQSQPSHCLEASRPSSSSSVPATEADWPTYRASNIRNSASTAKTSDKGDASRYRNAASREQPTPPIAVGESVYYADAGGTVYCVKISDGTTTWRFATGGEVKAAPSYSNGMIYVGSGDGCVYALDAGDGAQVWRFRAGPAERRIMYYGKLGSTWPVNTGVMVDRGIAYFGAGVLDRDGVYVYAVDAKTGHIKWENTDSGHVETKTHKGASLNGYFCLGKGRVWSASGNAFSPVGYDMATGATVLPSYASNSVYDPVRRGRDIGIFADRYVVHGGFPLFSSQDEWLSGGKGDKYAFAEIMSNGEIKFPELEVMTVAQLPAWDNGSVLCHFAEKTKAGVEVWDAAMTRTFIKNKLDAASPVVKGFNEPAYKEKKASFINTFDMVGKQPSIPDYEMRRWRAAGHDFVYSLALSQNAAIVVWGERAKGKDLPAAWFVGSLSRADGQLMWKLRLPDEPVINGLCVTAHGDVVVTMTAGGLFFVGQSQAGHNH